MEILNLALSMWQLSVHGLLAICMVLVVFYLSDGFLLSNTKSDSYHWDWRHSVYSDLDISSCLLFRDFVKGKHTNHGYQY